MFVIKSPESRERSCLPPAVGRGALEGGWLVVVEGYCCDPNKEKVSAGNTSQITPTPSHYPIRCVHATYFAGCCAQALERALVVLWTLPAG